MIVQDKIIRLGRNYSLDCLFCLRCTLAHSPTISSRCYRWPRSRSCLACWVTRSAHLGTSSFASRRPESDLPPSMISSGCRVLSFWPAVSVTSSWRLWGGTPVTRSGSWVWWWRGWEDTTYKYVYLSLTCQSITNGVRFSHVFSGDGRFPRLHSQFVVYIFTSPCCSVSQIHSFIYSYCYLHWTTNCPVVTDST